MKVPLRNPVTKGDQLETAFTFVELLVVLAIIALLGLMLLPAMARSKGDSRGFRCLNNNRELNRAWRMWTDDNNDLLLFASRSGIASDPNDKRAWLLYELDFAPDSKNWDAQVALKAGPMWQYCGKNANIWRCPSDESYVVVNGVAKPRVRSYSMNLHLGGFGGTDLNDPTLFPYRIYLKSSDIIHPGPEGLFVFLDLRPDSSNWGSFRVRMDGYSPANAAAYRFEDLPSLYHDGAATFSYADGHGEIHRWEDPRTTPPPSPAYPPNSPSPLVSPRNPDIAWLQDRTTRPK